MASSYGMAATNTAHHAGDEFMRTFNHNINDNPNSNNNSNPQTNKNSLASQSNNNLANNSNNNNNNLNSNKTPRQSNNNFEQNFGPISEKPPKQSINNNDNQNYQAQQHQQQPKAQQNYPPNGQQNHQQDNFNNNNNSNHQQPRSQQPQQHQQSLQQQQQQINKNPNPNQNRQVNPNQNGPYNNNQNTSNQSFNNYNENNVHQTNYYTNHDGQSQRSLSLEYGKSIKLLRNGDEFNKGHKFVINSRKYRYMDVFLDDISDSLNANFGAVRSIHTPINGHRVKSLEEIEGGKTYVAVGSGRFVRLNYMDIADGKRPPPQKLPALARTDYSQIQIPQYDKSANILIYVYRNGDLLTPPRKILFYKSTLSSYDAVMNEITNKVQLNNGAALRLYTMDGEQIVSPNQLINGGCYVAANKERFKKVEYYPPQDFNSSPRLPRKSDDDPKPSVNNNKNTNMNNKGGGGSFLQTNSQPASHNSSNISTKPISYSGKPTVGRPKENSNNHLPPVKPNKVQQTNVDKDESGFYKSRNQHDNANTVPDGKNMFIDMPVDYRKTNQIIHEEIGDNHNKNNNLVPQNQIAKPNSKQQPQQQPQIKPQPPQPPQQQPQPQQQQPQPYQPAQIKPQPPQPPQQQQNHQQQQQPPLPQQNQLNNQKPYVKKSYDEDYDDDDDLKTHRYNNNQTNSTNSNRSSKTVRIVGARSIFIDNDKPSENGKDNSSLPSDGNEPAAVEINKIDNDNQARELDEELYSKKEVQAIRSVNIERAESANLLNKTYLIESSVDSKFEDEWVVIENDVNIAFEEPKSDSQSKILNENFELSERPNIIIDAKQLRQEVVVVDPVETNKETETNTENDKPIGTTELRNLSAKNVVETKLEEEPKLENKDLDVAENKINQIEETTVLRNDSDENSIIEENSNNESQIAATENLENEIKNDSVKEELKIEDLPTQNKIESSNDANDSNRKSESNIALKAESNTDLNKNEQEIQLADEILENDLKRLDNNSPKDGNKSKVLNEEPIDENKPIEAEKLQEDASNEVLENDSKRSDNNSPKDGNKSKVLNEEPIDENKPIEAEKLQEEKPLEENVQNNQMEAEVSENLNKANKILENDSKRLDNNSPKDGNKSKVLNEQPIETENLLQENPPNEKSLEENVQNNQTEVEVEVKATENLNESNEIVETDLKRLDNNSPKDGNKSKVLNEEPIDENKPIEAENLQEDASNEVLENDSKRSDNNSPKDGNKSKVLNEEPIETENLLQENPPNEKSLEENVQNNQTEVEVEVKATENLNESNEIVETDLKRLDNNSPKDGNKSKVLNEEPIDENKPIEAENLQEDASNEILENDSKRLDNNSPKDGNKSNVLNEQPIEAENLLQENPPNEKPLEENVQNKQIEVEAPENLNDESNEIKNDLLKEELFGDDDLLNNNDDNDDFENELNSFDLPSIASTLTEYDEPKQEIEPYNPLRILVRDYYSEDEY